MAQTGYTPILIYSSSTASNAPLAANLTNSTLGSELAINIADGKLFYKDSGGTVQVIGWKVVPTTAGGTGLTTYTAGDTLYYASGTTLSKLGIGASGYFMSSSGTAPQWSAPAALTASNDTNVTLTVGGSASTALLNAASVTAGWTGLLSIARGGTNSSATPTAGGVGYGTGTAHAYSVAGTSGQALLSGAAGAPTWGTLGTGAGGTGLTSFTANAILYASTISTLATDSNFVYSPGSALTLTSANLKISDGNRLIMGATDPQIYGNSGVITFRTSSTDRIGINTAAMYPLSNGGMDLGTSLLNWGAGYFSGTATAAKFIPTSSTAPSSGLYLPSAGVNGMFGTYTQFTNSDYNYSTIGGKKTTVGTSATTISIVASDWATLCLINGLDGVGNFFADLVFTCTTGGPTAISSKSVSGAPASRTYTMSSGSLQLAMGSGSYTIYCQTINSI
jgi:hypothetical protein